MSKNVNSQEKHANPKKIQQMILTIIIIIGFLPLNIITALAASVSLGVTPIVRAPGINIDAFAVEAMIIEYLKSREISQNDLQGISANVLPDGGTDSQKSATLIDDVLRIFGLPASRQSVTNSVSLQFLVMNAINAGLPLALIGDTRQVVVDGYDDDSGFSVHVLNPETGQAAWSSISGVSLINPSFTIREVVTLFSNVIINTADYGTLTYSTVGNSLTGGNPPGNPVLVEAIKSSAPYVTSSDTVFIVNYGTGASNVGLYSVILNPQQIGDPQFLEHVFSLWEQYGSSDYTTFPILPLDSNGYVDVSNIKNDIRNLALINILLPSETSSNSYAQLDIETINDVINDHAHFWMYHDPFEDRQTVMTNALMEMVSSRGQLALDEINNDSQVKSTYLLELGRLLVKMGKDGSSIAEDTIEIIEPSVIYEIVFNVSYRPGISVEKAMALAHRAESKHIALQHFFNSIPPGSGYVIDLGAECLDKFLLALEPVAFLEETRDELLAVQGRLGTSGDDLLLRYAITDVVNLIDGDTDLVWEQLKDYWDSGQLVYDLTLKPFSPTYEILANLAAGAWGLPVIGQIYTAVSLGWTLGTLLSGNDQVHEKLHMALYAKDIEAVLHRVAYTEMRPLLVSEYQSGQIITSDLQAWDSAVHLTYLSEAYFWKNLKDGFNAYGPVTNLLIALYGQGTAHEVAEKHYLPKAIRASTFANKWANSLIVDHVIKASESLLFERYAGEIIAHIASPKNGESVTGFVSIYYRARATATPIDIVLDIDGSQLDSKINVDPNDYQLMWNSSAYNDGEPHILHLSVTDNNGISSDENITIVVGSPANANVSPTIEIHQPNNDVAFNEYTISWTDYDPDDDANITLGYEPSTNNSDCNGTVLEEYISEDADYNWWWWYNLPNTSGSSYNVYAKIKDPLHPAVCVYSPGLLTIETPTSGTGYMVDHILVDDLRYGDGDGAWESGEKVELKVYVKNISSLTLTDAFAEISAPSSSAAINGARDNLSAADPGITRRGDFVISATPGFSGSVSIQLDIYYRENWGQLKHQVETLTQIVSPTGYEPEFVVAGITYVDDNPNEADGDGIPESGEAGIHTYISLTNIGGAVASNITAVISQTTEAMWSGTHIDYPDIAPGQSAAPINYIYLDNIPASFSGDLPQTLTVYYGVNQVFSKSVSFTVTVYPVPRLIVREPNFDFGVVNPGTQVTHDFLVQNIGSQTASISGVTTSHPDLSFISPPASIPAGTTATFHALIDTTGLDSPITRSFTINSNAHILSDNHGTIVGTVHDSLQSSYQLLFQQTPIRGPYEIGAGDTDGDGLKDIILLDEYFNAPGPVLNYAIIIDYEQISPTSNTFQEVWRNSNFAMPGSIGDHSAALDDINGDGKTDIIVVTGEGNIFYLMSSGDNQFTITLIYSQTGHRFFTVAIGNADNDSYKDILVGDTSVSPEENHVFIFEFTGGSSFSLRWTSPNILEPSPWTSTTSVCSSSIADTDNDSFPELILGTVEAQLKLFENTGNNTYNSTLKLDRVLESGLTGDCDLVTGDFDQDGKGDIAYGNYDSNKLTIVESNGNDTWVHL